MLVKGLGEIKAIAFDIDGTLYAPWKLTVRALWHYVSHCIFFLHYGLVRKDLHGDAVYEDFWKTQAQMMGARMHKSPEEAQKLLDKHVYEGMKKYFKRIKCFDQVPETFQNFKAAGFKIGILSDFPPDQKGDIWGVRQYCDVVLGTEDLGALKPSPHSFLKMAEQLGVEPENILYVGNSHAKDIKGAHAAGMKTAFVLAGWKKFFNKPLKDSEISFKSYRQLQDIVLK